MGSTQKMPDSKPQENKPMSIKPLAFPVGINPMTYLYNTQLSPMNERDFQQWAQKLSKKLGRNVLNDQEGYDLRAHFMKGGGLAANNHMSDIGKKPNHETFSAESKWSTPGNEGGRWLDAPGYTDGHATLGNYVPSPKMFTDSARMSRLVKYLRHGEADMPLLSPYIARPQ
jgi:hypothetical protein